MSKTRCEECGRKKVELEPSESVWGCPVHDDAGPSKARCRGCWEYTACLLHHVSYKPERTVPICYDCHPKLHDSGPFLSHLQPDMTRREAEEDIDGMLKIGVSETEADLDSV